MSSLPLISHHLFVAAVGNEAGQDGKKVSELEVSEKTKAIPLEVLECLEETPVSAVYALKRAGNQ